MTISNSKSALQTILNHRSIRKFTEEPISEEILTLLLKAGQAGSSSKAGVNSSLQNLHFLHYQIYSDLN